MARSTKTQQLVDVCLVIQGINIKEGPHRIQFTTTSVLSGDWQLTDPYGAGPFLLRGKDEQVAF